MWPNIGYCALFSAWIPVADAPIPPLVRQDLVALLAVKRHGLTSGRWPVLGSGALFEKADFPNERLKEAGYVGAKVYDCGLAEALLSAFHGLTPWNDWKEENYLDTMLAPGVSRPRTARVLDAAELATYRAAKASGAV